MTSEVMAANNATLNWAYVNRTEIGYFHSGHYPRRAPGVDPDFPTWGTGEFEWRGFLDASEQPFDVDPAQGFMTSWNNKPARSWRASDGAHDYTAVYRSLLLDARLRPRLRAPLRLLPPAARGNSRSPPRAATTRSASTSATFRCRARTTRCTSKASSRRCSVVSSTW